MQRLIRVVLVDDHELMRAGFRAVLESEGGIEVVGEAGTGGQAVEVVLQQEPDVVCMDIQMPGVDGLVATRELTARAAGTHVLVLTTFDRDEYLFGALEAGASGFLLKNASPEQLITAVQTLARGEALLAPEVTRRVIGRFTARPPRGASMAGVAVLSLTAREREVLELVAQALSNAEIASRLFLGEATVKTHVSHLLTKLACRDRVQLVVYAYEHGLIQQPD